MAANFANMTGGPPRGKFGTVSWSYETTDSQATMNTANYFDGLQSRGGKVGDEIVATVWTGAVPTTLPGVSDTIAARVRFVVMSIDGSAHVDVADGDAATMTNTD